MLHLKVLASNLHGIGVNQVVVYSEVRVKRIVSGARGVEVFVCRNKAETGECSRNSNTAHYNELS